MDTKQEDLFICECRSMGLEQIAETRIGDDKFCAIKSALIQTGFFECPQCRQIYKSHRFGLGKIDENSRFIAFHQYKGYLSREQLFELAGNYSGVISLNDELAVLKK
ncbi:MAG: hypothetical protein WC852_06915 [Candidatus Nanoarchaeia archaeon]